MKTGKVSEACLKRSVFKQIKTKRKEVVCGAGIGVDCAIFAPSEGVYTGMAVQEAAVAVQAADGRMEPGVTVAQLIQMCANNLAAGGVLPTAAMLTLLLPEGAEEGLVRNLMSQAGEKCRELSVEIAGGQTRVLAAVSAPVVTVTMTGNLAPGTRFFTGAAPELVPGTRAVPGTRFFAGAAPGQDVVVSKWIGLQGTAELAERNRAGLLERYPAYLVEEAAGFDCYLSVIPEAATAIKSGVCSMHDVSQGGIFGALWEMAERAGVGLTIDMRKLPLRQETVEVCEYCGENPYTLLSGGSLLMTAEDGQKLVQALAAEQIPAAVVGKVTPGRDRILLNGEEIRYLERP